MRQIDLQWRNRNTILFDRMKIRSRSGIRRSPAAPIQ
jgi:hypothetical protein